MRELGRRGGSTPKMTALRRAALEQEDSLRDQARAVLGRALAGEQVDREALAAARSLYSFAASKPPADDEDQPLESLEQFGKAWLRALDKLD